MTMLSRAHRWNPCVHFWTLTLTFTLAAVSYAQAQQTTLTAPEDAITRDRQLILQAGQQHFPDEKVGYLWAVLAAEYRKAGDFAASENAYEKALHLLDHDPAAARNYATALDNLSMLYLTYGRLDEAEKYNQRATKIRMDLRLPLDEARSELHLAEIELSRHKFKSVEKRAAKAFETMSRLQDPDKLDLVAALNALAFSQCAQGTCSQGMEFANQSLTLARSSFGEQSRAVAHTLMAVGFAQWKLGRMDEADHTMRAAIQMMKEQEGTESRVALLAMMEYRNYLKEVHRDQEAENLGEEIVLAMKRQEPLCKTCVSASALANALK
jgi:tetratricopeptide (TPR) repeat protein